MELYLGDEKVAVAYAVEVVNSSSDGSIAFEYTYDSETNPAATVQSITERLVNYATLEALQQKQDNLVFDGEYNAETNPVATLASVANKIAEIVGGASEAYDTLAEIAAWIANHPQDAATMEANIAENTSKIATNAVGLKELKTYIDNFVTRFQNGALIPLKAKCDENGSRIPSTYAKKGVSGTVTLPLADWSTTQEKSITLTSLGTNDAIFFSPATETDKTAIEDADIFILTSGSVVCFKYLEAKPTKDITLKYFIARG